MREADRRRVRGRHKLLLFLYPAFDVAAAVYPAFDVAAAVVDARSARSAGPLKGLYADMAISTLAAVGIAIAITSGIADVLRVWGAWAVVSGLVQLLVVSRAARWAADQLSAPAQA